jgi:hypothetical protein
MLHQSDSEESRIIGFEVLPAVVMKKSIFWDITPCSPLKVSPCFGGKCAPYLHTDILLSLFFAPEEGGQILRRNMG